VNRVIPELRIDTSSIHGDVKNTGMVASKKNHQTDRNHDEKFSKTIGDWNAIRVCDPFHLPELS
jgi:hypothetical protein